MSTLKHLVKAGQKAKPFLGGLLLGSVGFKALASKDAKRVYAHVIAKGYEVRDSLEASLDSVKQEGEDVLADAKEIYEGRKKEADMESFKRAQTN